jgi:prevent-host-death family protein
MVTKPNQIAVGEFKAKCLSLLAQVAETGKEFVITKRGKAIARVGPMKSEWKSLKGSVLFEADDIITPDEEWDMEKDEDWHLSK